MIAPDYSRCQRSFHMSGAAPFGFQLEPATIQGICTKMMKPAPETADIAALLPCPIVETDNWLGSLRDSHNNRKEDGICFHNNSASS